MNNYFDDMQKREDDRKKKAVPAWVWVVVTIGLIVSIAWGYSMGSTTAMMANLNTIEDKTPESTKLGTLDFSDCLYVFSDSTMYNLIDYPASAFMYASTHNANDNGIYNNKYTDAAKYTITFYNMNYYDISCVFDPGDGFTGKINYLFDSDIEIGNFEAVILEVDRDYRTEKTEDGYSIIKSEYIKKAVSFDADKEYVSSIEVKDNNKLYILVVGAEGAGGAYTFNISAE